MKQAKILLLFFILLATVSFTAFHHGWSNYDQKKVLDYTGTIEKVKIENPHAMAWVKQKNKTWTVVLAPTSRMESRNVPLDKLKKGNTIRVVGYPHKTIKDEMRSERIFIEGVKYELR